jgi:hypothetical protein
VAGVLKCVTNSSLWTLNVQPFLFCTTSVFWVLLKPKQAKGSTRVSKNECVLWDNMLHHFSFSHYLWSKISGCVWDMQEVMIWRLFSRGTKINSRGILFCCWVLFFDQTAVMHECVGFMKGKGLKCSSVPNNQQYWSLPCFDCMTINHFKTNLDMWQHIPGNHKWWHI